MRTRLFRNGALFGFVLAPLSALSAQVTTMDVSSLGLPNYGAISQGFGNNANLNVGNQTRVGFGNAAQQCNHVDAWALGYSNLTSAAFACTDGTVAEFFFQPLNGTQVFLQSLEVGSWPSNGVTGPNRNFTLNIYDTSWTLLYNYSAVISNEVTLTPNVSSTTGLYMQWGPDWNTGVNDIVTVVGPAMTTTPEPATLALLAVGLSALAGFSRARRQLRIG